MRPPEPSCSGEARSRFKINKYGLKKPRDFPVSKGHGYPLVIHNKQVHKETVWSLEDKVHWHGPLKDLICGSPNTHILSHANRFNFDC
jgi:hypothetical protein